MSNQEAGWVNAEDVDFPEGMPSAELWRVLVMPMQPRRMSRGEGGAQIALPTMVADAEQHLNYIGLVVDMGPLAGKHEKFTHEGANHYRVKEGDWVIYGRYSGQKIEFRGVKLVMVNDDEILGIVKDREGFRVHV